MEIERWDKVKYVVRCNHSSHERDPSHNHPQVWKYRTRAGARSKADLHEHECEIEEVS